MTTAIMIQGTGSNVGKSLIAAGLCRLLYQQGYAVAPFKAQNMALNSAPAMGGEIGRAQALQALACGVEPSVLMNPILLKPTDEAKAQLVVNGKVVSLVTAKEYHRQKKEMQEVIKEAYQKLAKEYQVIVIEGAGSPAEINLKAYDLANMWTAKLAKAAVYLTGDIEQGGVFAALWGTFSLLSKSEQKLIKCFIINKFRGDKSLLDSGNRKLFQLTQKPTVGLIPYCQLFLEAEDSLSLPLNKKDGKIKIGVIKLPHLANFTDFQIFHLHHEVSLTYIENPQQIKGLHVCIIPGSKNTIGDLKWLKKQKFPAELKRFSCNGGLLIGICGGFQMLGKQISDPYGVEVDKGTVTCGLGLLPVETVLTAKKVVKNVQARANGQAKLFGSGLIKAYEIHTGLTKTNGVKNVFNLTDGCQDGAVNKTATIFGTYLHGVFDNDLLRKQFLTYVSQKAGLKVNISEVKSLNQRLNEWADVLRKSLNLNLIFQGLNGKNYS